MKKSACLHVGSVITSTSTSPGSELCCERWTNLNFSFSLAEVVIHKVHLLLLFTWANIAMYTKCHRAFKRRKAKTAKMLKYLILLRFLFFPRTTAFLYIFMPYTFSLSLPPVPIQSVNWNACAYKWSSFVHFLSVLSEWSTSICLLHRFSVEKYESTACAIWMENRFII